MPRERTIHYNPPADDGKTRCGLALRNVVWRTDPKDATCDRCRVLIAHDEKGAA